MFLSPWSRAVGRHGLQGAARLPPPHPTPARPSTEDSSRLSPWGFGCGCVPLNSFLEPQVLLTLCPPYTWSLLPLPDPTRCDPCLH